MRVRDNRKTKGAAKQVLEKMFETGAEPSKIVEDLGLGQLDDVDALRSTVREVIEGNAKAIGEYRSGKTEVLKFLVGMVMRATRGRANATQAEVLLVEELGAAN